MKIKLYVESIVIVLTSIELTKISRQAVFEILPSGALVSSYTIIHYIVAVY